MEEDSYLLKKIAAGDLTAFQQLYFRYQPKLVRFLTGFTHDYEDSRDIVQDIFLSIWNKKADLVHVESVSAYFYSMARNKLYDYLDHLSVVGQYAKDYSKNILTAETEDEKIFASELQKIINDAVEHMSPQRRIVYKMSREKGLSNDEIAVRLGINKRTVENHLSAALAILRGIVYVWIHFVAILNL